MEAQKRQIADVRVRIRVTGRVQGVGYRWFVLELARELGLAGLVRNEGRDVYIEAQGAPGDIERFKDALRSDAPPAARVADLIVEDMTAGSAHGFTIDTTR